MREDIAPILQSIGSTRNYYAPKELFIDELAKASLSYALAGEDLALRQLFKKRFLAKQRGIYVDIGCSEPVSISNTFLFYCCGWRGLCVDANARHAEAWAAIRKGDTFVNAAVGEAAGEVLMFQHKTNHGRNQIAPGPHPPSDEFDPLPRPVPMERLDTLLARHIGDQQIQFMTIDVEGAELGVLRSNDWGRWRPEVILVECPAFDFTAAAADPPVAFLLERNYALHLKIGGNVILVREAP